MPVITRAGMRLIAALVLALLLAGVKVHALTPEEATRVGGDLTTVGK